MDTPASGTSVSPVRGNHLLAETLAGLGVDSLFFIMGGPINDALTACGARGMRLIDVRHEQAAAMMAHAYARVRRQPGVCFGASGPGAINLTTGLANALVDCAPVVALGGTSPLGEIGRGAFQEIDQVAIMRPVTKWAERVHHAHRIPEYVEKAFRIATAGKPGPVFLDLPGDVLYGLVPPDRVPRSKARPLMIDRPAASEASVAAILDMLRKAERPIILSGSGILWSDGAEEFRRFVDATGIPFYTTPQGRGVIPEDHPFFFGQARTMAFKEADLVLVLGTRLSYVFNYGLAPRFASDATFIGINIDPEEVATAGRLDLGVVADAATALGQLRKALDGRLTDDTYAPWRARLRAEEEKRAPAFELKISTDALPVHPLRLCKEIRDFMSPDDILVVDGQEILNYGRQTLPSFRPAHRLNSGPFGTMGVGLPFGIGAKVAKPSSRVFVLHGDGSFGLNAMELDTAVRHGLPVLVIISLNGGWTADPERKKPGRELGYTRFDLMAKTLGCHGEFVETPEAIRPALERAAAAVAKGQTAVVNVVTDWSARASMAPFTSYMT